MRPHTGIIDVNAAYGYPFATNFDQEINIREGPPSAATKKGEFVTTGAMSPNRHSPAYEVGTYNIYRMYHEELESYQALPSLQKAQF